MKAVHFGPHGNLFGVLSTAKGGRSDLVAIAWNTGICSHIGPHRLNVEIAEQLSHQGISTFRFDLGNLGDSLIGSEETDLITRNRIELQLALNMLTERFGYTRFLLIGICSSAVDAHHAAVDDSRVVGLIMVDTYVYPTKKFHINYIKSRIFKLDSWKRLISRKLRELMPSGHKAAHEDLFEGVYPDQETTGKELQGLVDRGCPMLVLYTGGFGHVYTYKTQFIAMFPKVDFGDRLTLKHHPKADHLFTILEDRQVLMNDMRAWTLDHFAATPLSPTLLSIIERIDHIDGSAIAIEDGDQSYDYAYLQAMSQGLAARLAEEGLGKGSIVGLCLDRSPALIIGLVGILRSGSAYLPLDPHYPRDRLQTMIELAQCKTLLCHRQQSGMFANLGLRIIIWEDIEQTLKGHTFQSPVLSATDAAYVIFTSGSTGQPKGVVLGHGALTQLLAWHERRYPLDRPRTLQFTPVSFDVSFQEIFTTLLSGGTLVLITEDLRLDPIALIDTLETSRVQRLFLPFVALQFMAEAADALGRYPASLREVFTAGEALKTTPALRSFFKHLKQTRLHNHYGPSETHVITAYELPLDPMTWPALPSIGQAIEGSYVLLLDAATLKPVAEGDEGELYLGGLSLAQGYIHRPDLTAERFIVHPQDPTQRLYKTGDIGRINADGDIEFLGRKDGQIKIRGHRIEPGEIEVLLGAFPNIGQILVEARTSGDQIYLVAYYREAIESEALKAFAAERMPEAMRPAYYMRLDSFPLTPSGKIDRKALPSPFQVANPAAPAPRLEKISTGLLSDLRRLWAEILPTSGFTDDQNFFDAGGTSLLAMRFVTLLKLRLDLDLRIRDFFARPTLAGLVRHFNPAVVTSAPSLRRKPSASDAIAVVGMAVATPGASDLAAYWTLLTEGREGLRRFSLEELDPSLSKDLINDPHYVPVRGVLDAPDAFDHEFFSIGKREAELIDPQQRHLLQLCWQALEDAGLSSTAAGSLSGVFLGTGYNTYLLKQLMQNPSLLERAGDFQVMLANDKDYVATRVAYKLDLKGPALSLHTACSTSLVAIIAAVHSLRRGECDSALAGAMSIQFPSKSGHIYQEGGILSRDGHCRPFDAEATGTLFCDGGGVVVLKRLDDAVRDGDRIYSVIRGAAWNNDGREKASFSAPSLVGQMEVIRSAITDADVPAASISYVEAHGTATPIGDPLEWEALRQAFAAEGAGDDHACTIGSVKGNIGHTTASAGVMGLIKTSLALYYEKLPGTLHFQTLNPEITAGPFQVRNAITPWLKTAVVRRAGVSSFGVGGTNAHVVLEEAPTPENRSASSGGHHVLALSHRSAEGLDTARSQALEGLKQYPVTELATAYNTGRKHFDHRQTLICSPQGEVLANPIGKVRPLSLVWVFPGQGSQIWGMGQELYAQDAAFRSVLDEVVGRILTLTGMDFKAVYWLSEKAPIRNTKQSQLGLFAIGYALGKTLLNRGLRPDAMLGHSVGEWVAASLSGIFPLDAVIRVLSLRGTLMEALPHGAMLSVRADLATAMSLKPSDIDLAAANGAAQQVFSGPEPSIEHFTEILQNQGIASRRLETNHAFHSWMVESVCEKLAEELLSVTWQPMTIPLISTVHGAWLKEEEAHNPRYWAQHARVPVRFQSAIHTAAAMGDLILCELGPRMVCSNLSRKALAKNSVVCPALGEDHEVKNFFTLLSQTWIAGLIASESLQNHHEHSRTPGISYAFQTHSAFVVAKIQPKPSVKGNDHMRVNGIRAEIRALVEESSGEVIETKDDATHFTELGLDSLFLTQLSLQLRNKFKMDISFRQLMEELSSVASIADFIVSRLPAESATAPLPATPQPVAASAPGTPVLSLPQLAYHPQTQNVPLPNIALSVAPAGSLNSLFSQQLQVIQHQLALLSGQPISFAAPPGEPVIGNSGPLARGATESLSSTPASSPFIPSATAPNAEAEDPSKKTFGAMAKISRVTDKLGEKQKQSLEAFQKTYNAKTAKSKQRTQEARKMMADPRVVTGFKPVLKELIYPLLVDRSKGSELWDIDGNHYIDMLNGFGSNYFGYSPDFITKALKEQIDRGYELGPQHPLAIEASALATELTGFDRVAWCNTGSEAVLGAMRIARTVTGRTRIASFTGSYHGINDEVIIRGTKQLRPLAAAPGIMPAAVQNMLVLDYGTDEALRILRDQCKDLAAILVEPAQSRRPEFRPLEFLKELRKITEENGTVLIFDEVITGFRYHSGGFQTAMGIRADLGTYGKVVGGGLPIGMIAGKRRFMDALDGGHWNFGDTSIPEVGVTYFAGTFVRHPLALAAAVATLRRLKEAGPALQEEVNRKADRYVAELNRIFQRMDAPFEYANFGSLMKLKITDESRGYPELLACWLRNKGVHIWDGFPTFITCAHTDDQLKWVIQQFTDAISEMQNGGLLGEGRGAGKNAAAYHTDAGAKAVPNHPQAKLGVDEQGQAAWFIPDPDSPGKYKQLIGD